MLKLQRLWKQYEREAINCNQTDFPLSTLFESCHVPVHSQPPWLLPQYSACRWQGPLSQFDSWETPANVKRMSSEDSLKRMRWIVTDSLTESHVKLSSSLRPPSLHVFQQRCLQALSTLGLQYSQFAAFAYHFSSKCKA